LLKGKNPQKQEDRKEEESKVSQLSTDNLFAAWGGKETFLKKETASLEQKALTSKAFVPKKTAQPFQPAQPYQQMAY
jgi:hypothetical protein